MRPVEKTVPVGDRDHAILDKMREREREPVEHGGRYVEEDLNAKEH